MACPSTLHDTQTTHKGYARLFNAILADRRLNSTAKIVLTVLMDYRNARTGKCCPKWQTLQTRLNVSRSTIARAIARLQSAGYLTVHRHRTHCQYDLSEVSLSISRGVTSQPERCHSATSAPPHPSYELKTEGTYAAAAPAAGSPVYKKPPQHERAWSARKEGVSAQVLRMYYEREAARAAGGAR